MQKLANKNSKLSQHNTKNCSKTISPNIDTDKMSPSEISSKEYVEQQAEVAIASSTQAALFESSDKEIESIIDEQISMPDTDSNKLKILPKGKHKFFDMISDQLYELFNRYPKEENLSKLIDNSQWIKIVDDYDNINHVVGIIKDNDDIKYICYGVKGNYYQEPPVEMRGYSQWLPTDINHPENNGYWTMYQDADTGENIPIN